MKTIAFKTRFLISLISLLVLPSCIRIYSQAGENSSNEDKSLSPYFVILSNDKENEKLPLQSTSADVNIAGVIADVKITQVYKNDGKNPIEAIYVFPASTRAAVYRMKMTIGERTIEAKIEEKNKARKDYEDAKNQGKSASLLEQQRPNVFQMNVANIMPGDIIKVEMSYTELLIPEEGVYEFVYPTVVGPRYNGDGNTEKPNSSTKNEKWIANPYTMQGVKPTYIFNIGVNINAGMTLSDVRCNTHAVDVNYTSATDATISLKDGEKEGGNRDYILQYRLTGSSVQSGLLLYKGENENFFLAMIQPPKRITTAEIPPREYVFIMDVSGSMSGFPLEISKSLMKNLVSNLRPTDRFNIILFAGGSEVLSETSLTATSDNLSKAISWINSTQGGGGTELLPALQRALALKGTDGFSRTFVIATDGYVSIEKEAFDFVRNNLGNANFFPFGIGSSVNRFIIEGLAHVGMGEPFVIEKEEKASEMADKFRKYIQSPVLTDIKVKYNGFDVYDVEPLTVPDVMAERPVIIFGKWKGNAAGTIELTGKTGSGNYSQIINVSDAKPEKGNSALRYLWARQKIKILDDYSKINNGDEHAKTITELGLKYNLLTNYTSFIAIDSEVRNKTGNSTTVTQPLPLPEGVSNYAVGGSSGSGGSVHKTKSYSGGNGIGSRSGNAPTTIKAEDIQVELDSDDKKDVSNINTAAEYSGGTTALNTFIAKNISYPAIAKSKKIQGKVILQFTVDANGVIKNIKVIKSVDAELDKEAIRVLILTSGNWNPALKKGVAVDQQMTLPVNFVLNK